MATFAEILGGPQHRFCLTYEEWRADAIADPEAYGLTAEQVEGYKKEVAQAEEEKKH